jgi:AraC family transcriptional regulator
VADLAPPRFVDEGQLTFAGIARRYTPDSLSEIPLQWHEMQNQMGLLSGQIGGDAYGLWYDVLKGGNSFRYLAAARVGEFSPLNPAFVRAGIVPLHYAVFTHAGAPAELRRTVDAIMSTWLPSSGYEHFKHDPNQPDFIERYSEKFNRTGEGPIEIWLPVKKR